VDLLGLLGAQAQAGHGSPHSGSLR
jgi:hypothetical protein